MPAFEILSGIATAPDTTFTEVAANTGNSFTVRNAGVDVDIRLIQAWAKHQTAGNFRIRSPRMHDNVQGIRLYSVASQVRPLIPEGFMQRLYSQDDLTVELTGSATAGDIEIACMLLYYASLPGVEGRFASLDDIMQRIVNLVTVENTLALGTSGNYTGEEAINAEFDLLRANTDYALLGYLVSAECACIRWRGVDFGNLGVGGPGNETEKELTANWFVNLCRQTGLPCIPVFNSANKEGLLLDGVQDENGADTIVTSILAQLSM